MKRQIVSVLALLALAANVCATDAVRMLEDFSVKIQSAAGRFTQTAAEDGQVLATGRFSFTRPGMFLWETQSPFFQTILCDGRTLWIYDPDFRLSDRGKIGGLLWVRAIPKASDAAFSAMDVGMDENGIVRELRLTDSFGEVTLYKLSEVLVPSELHARDYKFRIPPGTDVLKDTSQQ